MTNISVFLVIVPNVETVLTFRLQYCKSKLSYGTTCVQNIYMQKVEVHTCISILQQVYININIYNIKLCYLFYANISNIIN